MTTQALSPRAFVLLLVLATMFGGNHVAARLAIDHGVNVPTAVVVRSLGTAVVVALIVVVQGLPWRFERRHWRVMPLISALVAVQSLCLYAAVARIPVGLALLAFNTYPLWTAAAAWALYGQRPERAVLIAMPLILAGLALALNVPSLAQGATGGDGASRVALGVPLAVLAAAVFGVVLALTQHEVAALDGRVRTAFTMVVVGLLALLAAPWQGGLQWPRDAVGWSGLAALTVLYGTAFTVMFTLLPRLGVVGNSPILNVEPVAALVLGWWILGQSVTAIQWAGALLVVGTVMGLGLRRR